MFNIAVTLIDIFVAWRWGDWRNWTKYQSTILYMIMCDLLYNFLTYNYPMWTYTRTAFLPNHTLMNIFVMFIAYPCMLLVYLGHFPRGAVKRTLWILLWVALWSALEWVSLRLGHFLYHNEWTFGWSVLFNITLFLMVWLHYNKPLLAYGLSVIVTTLLSAIFQVPMSAMK